MKLRNHLFSLEPKLTVARLISLPVISRYAMRNLSLIIVITGLFAACNPKNKKAVGLSKTNGPTEIFAKDTQLHLYLTTLTVPKGWRFALDDTLPKVADATFRIRLHNKSGKLIYIEHGLSTNGDRSEPEVVPASMRAGYLRNRIDTAGVVFSDDPRLPDMRRRLGYKFSFEPIGGYRAKLFEPGRVGLGYSGVYIDSVGFVAGNVAEFSLYAENLDRFENAELKSVIRTLVLRPFQ